MKVEQDDSANQMDKRKNGSGPSFSARSITRRPAAALDASGSG